METKEWLATSLNTNKENIEQLYRNPIGLDFLLVWTRFEKINFNGFMKYKKEGDGIGVWVDKIKQEPLSDELESIYNKFAIRYKGNKKKFLQLCNIKKIGKYGKTEKDILENLNPSLEEKKYLLIFIAYRYRNNMFHGSKGIGNWVSQYEEQIKDCIKIMMEFTPLQNSEGDNE
ncbi:MAG: hypothetical protein ACRCZ9_13030 [Fusobacteriaceae bacterium]